LIFSVLWSLAAFNCVIADLNASRLALPAGWDLGA